MAANNRNNLAQLPEFDRWAANNAEVNHLLFEHQIDGPPADAFPASSIFTEDEDDNILVRLEELNNNANEQLQQAASPPPPSPPTMNTANGIVGAQPPSAPSVAGRISIQVPAFMLNIPDLLGRIGRWCAQGCQFVFPMSRNS